MQEMPAPTPHTPRPPPVALRRAFLLAAAICCLAVAVSGQQHRKAPEAPEAEKSLRSLLDAPLLFVERHPYMAGHIYDDYLTWHPGGGIYLIENP